MSFLRLALVVLVVASVNGLRRVCYHTNWAQYRNGAGKFFPENIDPNLCTHIIYAFAKIENNQLRAFEWNDESTPWMKGMYEKFTDLRKINPNIKMSIAVGGWNMGSGPFTRMVANPSTRQKFATQAVKFLRDNGFDGLDIDWEYPAARGSPAVDKQHYVELLQDLRREFDAEASTSGKDKLLLSAATPAGKDNFDNGFNVPEVIKYLDMINLMTYDLHGSWEDVTGHNSPLYKHKGETGNNTYLNIDWAANYYVQKGVPASMINVGLGMYGRSFTLSSSSNHDLGASVRGPGQAGMYTREAGFLSYYEVCKMLKEGGTKYMIDDQKSPYAVKGDQWVGYDDADSLRVKVQYIKQHQFGGVMVWALDLDDFSGSCGEGKFPLLTAINDEVMNGAVPPLVQTTTPQIQQTSTPNAQQQSQTNGGGGSGGNQSGMRRVCYHTNWAQYRNGDGKFFPTDIDPTLCTHIIYAFAKIENNKLTPFEWNDESTPWSKGMYEKFTDLKKINPNLKLSIAVGGWNMGSAPFTRMVANPSTRQSFATQAVKFLRDHGFDGLDIDWEYPAARGSPAADKQHYVELLQDLRREFDAEAATSGKEKLLLSAATPAGKDNFDNGFNVPEVIKYLDMINLMTYDLHGSWEDVTGHNSPLYKHKGETGNNTYLNIDWAANYYVQKGVPASMINVGLGMYGRSFTLSSSSNHDLGASVRGPGQAGMYTREAGFLSYYEVCKMLKSGGTKYMIDDQKSPYAVKGDQWVGYDDPDSLRTKVQYIKQHQFGGVMVWALDLDDFSGSCGEGKFPLLTAINDEVQNGVVPPLVQTTPPPTQQSTAPNSQSQTNGSSSGGNQSGMRRVCYHTNWAQYRNGDGKFFPTDIDPTLCTHIIYAFAKIENNQLKPFEWNDESTPWSKGMYEKFTDLKKINPNLKLSIAVGGWNMGSGPFTRMVANPSTRQSFATQAVKFLRDHGFDGLDIDWEYPAARGSPAADKQNYVELLKDLRREIDAEAATSGKEKLLLSAATPAGKDNFDNGFNVPEVIKYLDMINLMTYDLHGSWEDVTGHNSPLYKHKGETGNNTYLNIDWAANYYVQKGVPASMINVGLGMYGRSFTLSSSSNHDLGASVRGPGQAGMYTREAGFLSYYEVCKMLKSGGTKYMIDDQKSPYAVKGDQWVGYDDPDSLRTKVQYIKQHQFGGVMVWALDLDDFSGSCGEGKFPLLTAINDEVKNGVVLPLVQTTASSQQGSMTTTDGSNNSNQGGNTGLRRVCYHTNWAQYRNGAGKFFPENIDPTLCTHIIYAFAKIENNKLTPFEWNDESTPWSKGMYEKFTDLKKINPNLKLSIAVGGWNMGSAPFTRMVANPSTRQSFATQAVKFLRDHGFDGLDIDWEYPAARGSPAVDKQHYVELLQDLRREFDAEAQTSGKDKLILSAATPAGKDNFDNGFNVPEVIKYLDMINLMTYDLHGSWEDVTGHNSPLYKHAGETGNNTYLNIDWAANYYVQKGVPASMINVGLGMYGRSFTLSSSSNHDLGAPVRGAGQAGMYTREAGFLSYYEVCKMLKEGGTKYMIDDQKSPYAVKGDQWVGYDDPDSLRTKVQYIAQHQFGGVMVWALDLDDFSGSCGEGKFPLLHAINDEVNRAAALPAIQPTTAVGGAQTTQASNSNNNNVQPNGKQTTSNNNCVRRVCYFANWAQYRVQAGKYMPENIDASLCTHIIFAFAKLNGNKLQPTEWNDENMGSMAGLYQRVNDLKKSNPNLKVMLAVGGWTMGSAPFTQMVSTPASRQEFATSTVKFLRDHGFDGLDIDWEYPAARGSPATDKQKYVELVKLLRSEFSAEATSSGNSELLLSAATPCNKNSFDNGYDAREVSKYIDFYNLMAYDLHGTWDGKTGHHAALYQHAGETGADAFSNIDWNVNHYIQSGVPPEKINLGMGMYGRSFTLSNPANHGVGAPISGAGTAGPIIKEKGIMSYYEICQFLQSGGQRYFIDDQKSTYAVNGNQWIGYDDKESLKYKVQYVKDHHLGGAMVWSIDMDDFSGSCGEGKYPLLNTINNELGSCNAQPATQSPTQAVTQAQTQSPTQAQTQSPTQSPTQAVTQAQTQSPTQSPTQTVTQGPTQSPTQAQTQAPGVTSSQTTQDHHVHHVVNNKFDCTGKVSGFYPDPTSCDGYFICAGSASFEVKCVSGMLFNQVTELCDYAANVNCPLNSGNQGSATQPPMTQAPVTQAPVTQAPVTQAPTTTTTTTTTQAPTQAPSTSAPNANGEIKDFCQGRGSGHSADPNDCGHYYLCDNGNTFRLSCNAGTVFNPTIMGCDFPSHVPGCENYRR